MYIPMQHALFSTGSLAMAVGLRPAIGLLIHSVMSSIRPLFFTARC